jgi:hypothetical protein
MATQEGSNQYLVEESKGGGGTPTCSHLHTIK